MTALALFCKPHMTCADRLWRKYLVTPTNTLRHDLIEHYIYLVEQTFRRLFPDSERLDVDKVKSAGKIGLIKAFDRFEPDRKVKFETYAIGLIRGEMLEDVRCSSWVPRSIVDQWKHIDRAVRSLIHSTGEDPSDETVALWLGWGMDYYYKIQASRTHGIVYNLSSQVNAADDGQQFEDLISDINVNVENHVLTDHDRQQLHDAIDQLSPSQSYIIRRHLDDCPNRQIALELGFSETVTSTLYKAAVMRLRNKLDSDSVWRQKFDETDLDI
jgi:RNA polymerase sigma factor FliA